MPGLGRRRWLCAALIAAGCASAPERVPVGIEIASLQLHLGAGPTPGGGAALDAAALDALGGFQTVALPDYWPLSRRRRGLDGWYRADFALPGAPGDWALAVGGSWDRLDVFVNGERLVESAADERVSPVGFFSSADVQVAIPRTWLREGSNQIAFAFHARPDEIGSLRRVALGPASALAAAQRHAALWNELVPQLLALFALACGLLVLLLARWSETMATLWFGIGTTLWSAALLLTPLAGAPGSAFGLAVSAAAHAFPPCIAVGFLRALGLRRPRTEAVLAASVAAGVVARAAVAPLWVPVVDVLWWTFDAGVGLYAVPLAAMSVRRRALPAPHLVFGATAIVAAAGVADLGAIFAGRNLFGFSLFLAASPLIGVAAASGAVSALSRALDEARRLNAELEQRVADKHRDLDASYARTALLERDRAIAAERERMMRDMHDGAGGQLVTALALVERGTVPREALADALQEALADLRLVIDSLEPGEPDLLALLAHARSRLEPRLERHGVRFAWEVADVPAPERFGPEQSLHVLRVFQEAVTNALKHACARTIGVRTGLAADAAGRHCVYVEVADDGGGFAGPLAPTAGRGVRNMRRRADELGGTLSIESTPRGTVVRLLIPVVGPDP